MNVPTPPTPAAAEVIRALQRIGDRAIAGDSLSAQELDLLVQNSRALTSRLNSAKLRALRASRRAEETAVVAAADAVRAPQPAA